MSIEDFYTADEADEGIKLPLYDKYGNETDEWLMVRGMDSEAFRNAKLDADRKSLMLVSEDDDIKRRTEILQIKKELTAVLVIGWSDGFHDSFGEVPTVESVCKFFDKAPQIMDRIDQVAGNRRLFFSMKQKNSVNTSEAMQSLTE